MPKRLGHLWRPDDDAKKVDPRIIGEARRYARKGLIAAGLRKPSKPKVCTAPPKPSQCPDCGEILPSKNALDRHRAGHRATSEVVKKRALRKLAERVVQMQMGIDPMRPELGKAPKGSLMAAALQRAAAKLLTDRLRDDPALVQRLRVPNPAPVAPVPNKRMHFD